MWMCLEVLHRSWGGIESRLFADLQLQRPAHPGPRVRSVAIWIRGVNHGHAWVLDDIAQAGLNERSRRLDGPGRKEILKVVLNLEDGRSLDVTRRVLKLLGTAEFEVRYPEDVTVGSCDSWIPKFVWRIS
jgi:hypothetical protein